MLTFCYPTDPDNSISLTFCYHLANLATSVKSTFAYTKYLAGFLYAIFLA